MSRSSIHAVLCLIGATILLLSTGCSDNDPVSTCTDPGAKTVTVRFAERTECQGCDLVVVFTSDLDGAMHDYALRTDESEIELEVPPSAESGFYVTHILDRSNNPTTEILTTHHSVEGDREVERFLGSGSCGGPRAELNFTNIPEHTGYVLGAEPCILGDFDQLPDQKQILTYRDPLDLLLTIDPVGAPRSYMWLEGVKRWSERVFDLNDLVPLAGHLLELPPVTRGLYINVAAWTVDAAADTDHKYYILNSHNISSGLAEVVLEVGSPDFARYEVRAQTSLDWNPTLTAVTRTEGPLPGSISFWNAEIEIQESSPDGFLIDVVEGTDEVRVRWKLGEFYRASWEIDVPVPSQAAALPALPEFVATLYPYLVREEFVMNVVTATRHSEGVADNGGTMKITQESSLFGLPRQAR